MPEGELQARVQTAMQHARGVAMHQNACAEVALRWATLTPREKDVARLLRLGWANKSVADQPGISVRVVETHRARVFEKRWVSNPTELDRLMRDHQIE
jgi:two-component system response regulator DctR